MPRFVRGDEVREDSSESRVIRPIDVCVGAGDDLRSTVRLVDVAGFAVIVPWDPSVSMERNETRARTRTRIDIQVMICTKSGLTSRICIHRSYHKLSPEEYQFLFHCGSPVEL